MIAYKLLRLIFLLFSGLLTCALVFPLTNAAGRERRIKDWSARLLKICGVHVIVNKAADEMPVHGALIVANHISWLDIFVINSMQPCRFVAKSDIRDWPLLGWLCDKAGTIFIARGRQRDVRRIYEGLVASIRKGERIAFFPEGTTAVQGKILPFHANLFEAAIEAKVPIQPYALRYMDSAGNLHSAAEFIGDTTFVQSVMAILKSDGMITEVTILPAIDSRGAHRRELAGAARSAIGTALGYLPN
ncbi:MAG: acyl-phosphate glycerol 3-phosphate acyltransferase [Burkholderiales bacterium RIFCSPLOWO2_02_FULL_57_36]|nr:MAG: acyl-phosphate glycerol 3-phosphate acyltransferase [Burkholderiales bacterium RIFCSPLOWO2_02_FULL_57_36]